VYETALAQSFAAAGETDKALKTYNVLAQRYPKDGDIHEARARLLMDSGDTALRQQALTQWQTIEKKSRRGSDRWFRARLAQAQTLISLSRHNQAAKLIKLTQVLHPDLGDREMKLRFEKLLNECEM
jgi:tetratricopeptide (TPR) repeat protein